MIWETIDGVVDGANLPDEYQSASFVLREIVLLECPQPLQIFGYEKVVE